jgi:hypothetical protein
MLNLSQNSHVAKNITDPFVLIDQYARDALLVVEPSVALCASLQETLIFLT